jgi:hypothetical protein
MKDEKEMCCGVEMELEQMFSMSGEDVEGWTCLNCGHFRRIVEGYLDEDDLDNEREHALDEGMIR